MTAEEADPVGGDEYGRVPIDPVRDRRAGARPARAMVAFVLLAWAAISLGFVGALWLFGAKGPPFVGTADTWVMRDHVSVASLPGAGVLTRLSVLEFPLHWAVVGIGSVAGFIALAALYNLHVDARGAGAPEEEWEQGSSGRERAEGVDTTRAWKGSSGPQGPAPR